MRGIVQKEQDTMQWKQRKKEKWNKKEERSTHNIWISQNSDLHAYALRQEENMIQLSK